MDRENARQEIISRWREIIPAYSNEAKQKKHREPTYICPFCGHGAHGEGIQPNDKSEVFGLKCFDCNWSGNIIDLVMGIEKEDYNTALNECAQQLNITIDRYRPDTAKPANIGAGGEQRSAGSINAPTPAEKPAEAIKSAGIEAQADYTEYYKQCAAQLQEPAAMEYLKSRGISEATAQAYNIGFDPKSDPAGTGFTSPRIIIPVNAGHYVARAITPNAKIKALNPKGSTPGIFNLQALYAQEVQEVIVTEGVFDALSVIEAGAPAIATNSASNTEKLLKQLEQERTAATLILCFDNDSAGERATATMREGLQRLNISFTVADICGGCKDANEALQKDRQAFIQAVSAARAAAAAKPDNISLYINSFMGDDIAEFKQEIKTGFANIDNVSNGLYSGLYCLAAISSLGKTTFAHQMADQIAAAGNDVLYFSLEQSRLEMVSKSLARITAQNDINTAVTSLEIRKGKISDNVMAAAEQYKKAVQDRISIIEGNFNCNVTFIGDYIAQYMRRNPGTKPVIFVDYLQILQPEVNPQGRQQTIRETVDTTVTTLKRISRAHGLTIFVICSVNRSNYLLPIDFEAIKESGGIEYTCDVVWGLQLQCLNDPIFEKEKSITEKRERIKKAKKAEPRKIELVCLKNRYGIANYSAYFDYYSANDLFKPCTQLDSEIETEQPKANRKPQR